MQASAYHQSTDEDEVGLLETQGPLPVDHHQTHHPKVPDDEGKAEPVDHQLLNHQSLTAAQNGWP